MKHTKTSSSFSRWKLAAATIAAAGFMALQGAVAAPSTGSPAPAITFAELCAIPEASTFYYGAGAAAGLFGLMVMERKRRRGQNPPK